MKGIVLNRPVDDFSGLNSWLTEWSKDTQVAISSIWMLSNRDSYIFTNFKYLIQEQCFDIKQFDKELVKWLKRGIHNSNKLLMVYGLLVFIEGNSIPNTVYYVLNKYKMQLYFIFNSHADHIKYNSVDYLFYKRQEIYETFLDFIQMCIRRDVHRDLAVKILSEEFDKFSPDVQQKYYVEVYLDYNTRKWKLGTDEWIESYSEYTKTILNIEQYKEIKDMQLQRIIFSITKTLIKYFCPDYIFNNEDSVNFDDALILVDSFLLDRCLPLEKDLL